MPFDGEISLKTAIGTAQELIRRDGWCKRRMYNCVTGHRCVVGAVLSALGVDLTKEIEKVPGPHFFPVVSSAMDKEVFARRPTAFARLPDNSAAYRPCGWTYAMMWNDQVAKNDEEAIDFLECVKNRL